MLNEFIEELKHNQNINYKNDLENRVDISYVIEKLENINVWFEVAKNEVITAIEDIYNDDLYKGYEQKLEKISDDEINTIAWRVEDYDVWDDVYDYARSEILEIIESEDK